ncbi:MAG: helix-turn-helix transcriptional regulator [Candidatus Paceibacterales bacterium]
MKNTVRVERAKLDITQADLAEKVNVSKQTILSIEKGKFTPSAILAMKIARYFNVKMEDIFELEPGD